ncbi:hypothetical protein BT96DRAFT_987216 [Gymnopus androsaceus JB14]|uniref:Uncharacterized protein n=1 Tax=Gymnopus androsaceus JB14 TaxID=1447944 RepID=A0A6A4I7S8_9AGAR|nr:hypothetical protein BT96DRAFT_987216 [Gymnopus androsaceus JB14]
MSCAYPLGELPEEAGEKMQGTEDIYVFADAKNGNMNTYANEDNPGASRTLEERWINYLPIESRYCQRRHLLSRRQITQEATLELKYLQCLVMMSRGQTHSAKTESLGLDFSVLRRFLTGGVMCTSKGRDSSD